MVDPILDMLANPAFRERPALFIGRRSVHALWMYLIGYCAALNLSEYDRFINTLYAKYGLGGGGDSWASVLAQATGSDEAALDLFFVELDMFQKATTE